MISGDRPRHPGRHDARQRRQAEFLGLGVAHDDHRGGAVVQRAGVARGDGAVGPEHRLELADLLVGGAGRGPSSVLTVGAVGQRDRRDLALEEPALDGLLGAVLAAHAPVVLVLAADAGEDRDVLGGLAHRDVDVGQRAVLARVVPFVGALGRARRALLGVVEQRVLGVGPASPSCP